MLKYRIESDVVFYSVAYFLFLKRQFPKIEIHKYADSYEMVKENGFESVREPDFWKFSDWDLDDLLNLFNKFQNSISIETFSDEEFYRLAGDFLDYYINASAQTRGQFTTPDPLIQLICELISVNRQIRVYNPTAGILKLLTALHLKFGKNIYAIASEINYGIHEIGSLFAAINGFDLDFKNTDSVIQLEQIGRDEFDLIVAVPPFNSKSYPSFGNYESYNDVALDIISSSLYKLRDFGKAIFLVVDGVLFSESKNQKRFRREIIESKMLHTVISLPVNLFYPYSAVKTSLLFFEKSTQQSSVRFIDVSNKNFYSITREKAISLDVEKIVTLFKSKVDNLSGNRDERKFDIKTSLVVDYDRLKKNDYSLSIQKFLMIDAQQFQDLGDVKLNKILKHLHLPLNREFEIPYVRITDLNGGYLNNPERFAKNRNRTRGRILADKAILIGLVGGSSKPSFYGSESSIEVSTNIAVFKLDTEQVDLDYLLQELNSNYIKDQFEFMAVGSTSLRHLKVSDLLKATIKLPPLNEQRRIAKERMQFLKERQIPTTLLTDGISSNQVIKTLKHEIDNILKGPSGFLNLLPKFLEKFNIGLDLPSANYKGARSIGDRIESASVDISRVNQIMETMEGILLAESSSFVPKNSELLSYLRKRFEKLSEHQQFEFYIGVDNNYQNPGHIYIEIDKIQFDHLVDNIIINAIQHNDSVNGKLIIVVNVLQVVNEKSKDVEIHFMNNGNKLSGDFSIDDYIGFSKKTGNSKGQGIGGFLINRITQNHHGKISLLPPSNFNFKSKDGEIDFKSNFEIVIILPQKQ